MSHKTVYMGIPANKLDGKFDPEKIASFVKTTMEQYVEETAKEGNVKCDWYVIGGRWEGSVAAIKGTQNILETQNGQFAYTFFDQYNAVMNNGQSGPYIMDNVEYIPVDGGLKKDIAWDAIAKWNAYNTYLIFKLILQKDPRFGGGIPEGYKVIDEDLYLCPSGKDVLAVKNNENFYDWAKRLGETFERIVLPPDAYIDTKGVWHDENDLWKNCPTPSELTRLLESSQEMFTEVFEKFLDEELQDDDCFVVLDCHCFP